MNKLKSILLATRPKTLPAGFIAVWAGCIIVWKFQHILNMPGVKFDAWLAAFTACSCACIQIACNLFNDALDFRRHADTERRQGPRRITASGDLPPNIVMLLGFGALGLAALFALPLIAAQGWGVIAIGLPCMLFAYGYTGGPFPLAYHGLGELFVLLFFGLVGVCGTVFVQIGWQEAFIPVYAAALIVGVQCGLLSCVLIEVNNIRDRVEDASTGKRTLAVRLGDARARGLAMAFVVAPYVTLKQTAFFLQEAFHFNFCWWVAMAVGGFILLKLRTMPADKRMNMLLGISSLHMILYLTALTL